MYEQGGYYVVDDFIADANDTVFSVQEPKITFESLEIQIDDSLIRYKLKPDNKIIQVNVNRAADLIFKKGDYLHTYITIDATGVPNGTVFKLVDEDDQQLYSPFTPDGMYQKYECQIKVGEIDVIPLPANYNVFQDWIDYNAGIYNWRLVSVATSLYDSISIDLQVIIVDFEVFEPVVKQVFADESVIYKVRDYLNTIPLTTNLLTSNAVYDKETGCIRYPPEDLDMSTGAHAVSINNQLLYYEVKPSRNILTDIFINLNGDLECTIQNEHTLDSQTIISSLELENGTIIAKTDLGDCITDIKIDNNGDIIFDNVELGQ